MRRVAKMVPTGSLRELVQRRLAHDPDFARALLREGVYAALNGDVENSKHILLDDVEPTEKNSEEE